MLASHAGSFDLEKEASVLSKEGKGGVETISHRTELLLLSGGRASPPEDANYNIQLDVKCKPIYIGLKIRVRNFTVTEFRLRVKIHCCRREGEFTYIPATLNCLQVPNFIQIL
jgi:hypothetical protein